MTESVANMSSIDDAVREHAEGSLIHIKVRPGSSRQGLEGMSGGRLVTCVHSPPEKGKANREALKVLADALSLPPSRLEVIKGASSRNKTVLARDISPDTVRARLRRD